MVMEAEVIVQQSVGLAKMREPFPDNLLSQLPKPTKDQNKCPPNEKRNCATCGGWHHPKVIHLTYVGHAAITDRLLDVDPNWSWEPMALDPMGLPMFDSSGGLWIKLTVLGVTRIGYGHAAAKEHMDPGAREKEVIGDALRNAAMRFGAALDLWHKGDLHAHRDEIPEGQFEEDASPPPKQLPESTEKRVTSPPKAPAASAEKKSAPAKEEKTESSAKPSSDSTASSEEKPGLDANTLKTLITECMKKNGWKLIKLREFYHDHVDEAGFEKADTMPLDKMRLLHSKLVEKAGCAPF